MEDVNVIYTRKTDRFIGLDERAVIANNNKANLFISIHTNSLEIKNKKSRLVNGAETYTMGLASSEESLEVAKRENSVILLEEDYLQKYEGFNPNSAESYIMISSINHQHIDQSIRFASEIQKSFKKAKRNDRDVRQAGLVVLRKTSMPSVLVELGFITNEAEERFLSSAEGQKELAKAIYNAFVIYKREYDKNKKVTASQPKPVTQSTSKETASQPKNETKIYKIQILASKAKITLNSKQLKGYKNVEVLEANGYYRYMYGKSTDLRATQELHKKVVKDFKDAFIVSFTIDDSSKTTKTKKTN
jgi:N-acetylmuramoyl-L-alanine amidase